MQPPGAPPDAPAMRAGVPTALLTTPDGDQQRSRYSFWPRTLRWRLILTYALLLGLMMLLMGIALDAVIGRTMYNTEFGFFQSEAVAAVSVSQPRFDTLTLGRAPNCAGALSYETAFQQAIADPIVASHSGNIQGVYLLDSSGAVLAPLSAQANVNATRYLSPTQLAKLDRGASALFNTTSVATGSQQLAHDGYFVNSRTVPYGVELIALRYYTTSRCAAPARTALGYVEIVTTFTRTRLALGALRLTLIVIMALVFIVGLLVGAPLVSVALGPLTRVTQAARRVASGDLSHRVRLRRSDDEMGLLAATFDEMVARIEAAFVARQRSEERMREFIADASHELRTPLTSIRGYTDVLLRGAKDDPVTTERVLQATKREAERMSRLVNDLLTLARLDTGRPLETKPVNLIALAGDCVDQARILAGKREVMMQTDGRGQLLVMGDSDRLKQVMLVLLDNALKYGRQSPDGWARLSVVRRDGQAVVTVEDNGPGIAPQDLPRLFERFYRAERAARARRMTGAPGSAQPDSSGQTPQVAPSAAEGSGLGLSIAYAIAQAHGGSLSAQNARGGGAVFTLTLPISPAPMGHPARGAQRRGA